VNRPRRKTGCAWQPQLLAPDSTACQYLLVAVGKYEPVSAWENHCPTSGMRLPNSIPEWGGSANFCEHNYL